jgi:hypothetical protein
LLLLLQGPGDNAATTTRASAAAEPWRVHIRASDAIAKQALLLLLTTKRILYGQQQDSLLDTFLISSSAIGLISSR